MHFAHGYLAQSFFSVHANQRTDQYGGDYAGRSRFLLETLAAVRDVWPEQLPLTARFGVVEFDGRDEETLSEAIELSIAFRKAGLDMLSVSMGFSIQLFQGDDGVRGIPTIFSSPHNIYAGGSSTPVWRHRFFFRHLTNSIS